MASTLQEIRKAAGYKTAKDFAESMGLPLTTYSRYESNSEKIPTERAWAIADALNCTIDEVVGRQLPGSEDDEPTEKPDGRGEVQREYDALSGENKKLVDQFMAFVKTREAIAVKKRLSDEERKFEDYARYYENLFNQSAEHNPELQNIIIFGSSLQKYDAFRNFITAKALDNRQNKLAVELEEYELNLLIEHGYLNYLDDGSFGETGKERTPEGREAMDAEFDAYRDRITEQFAEEDAANIEGIMSAYERIHGFGKSRIEYAFIDFDASSLSIEFDSDANHGEED